MLCARLFWGRDFWFKTASVKVAFCVQVASRAKREALHKDGITPPRAWLINLNNKEVVVGGRWPTDRFYFADTIGTERIESHAILSGYHMFGKLCL